MNIHQSQTNAANDIIAAQNAQVHNECAIRVTEVINAWIGEARTNVNAMRESFQYFHGAISYMTGGRMDTLKTYQTEYSPREFLGFFIDDLENAAYEESLNLDGVIERLRKIDGANQ